MPTGIDVSRWNGPIDWAQVRAAGHEWAACKATTGRTGVDRRFAENWRALRTQGFRWRAAYHLVTNADPAAQVRHVLDVVGDLRPGETLVADAEDPKVPGAVHRAFLELLAKELAPRRPIYYAYAGSPGYHRFGDAITLSGPGAPARTATQPRPEDWFDVASKEDLEAVVNAAILKAIDALRRDNLVPIKRQLDNADSRETKRWQELFATGAPRKS